MPRNCGCGGICKGNSRRCEFNQRMQMRAASCVQERRAEMCVVNSSQGEDSPSVRGAGSTPKKSARLLSEPVFLLVLFADRSSAVLTAEQLLRLPREYLRAIVHSEFFGRAEPARRGENARDPRSCSE